MRNFANEAQASGVFTFIDSILNCPQNNDRQQQQLQVNRDRVVADKRSTSSQRVATTENAKTWHNSQVIETD